MPRKQGNARWETMASVLLVSALALGLAGCKALTPERVETPPVERREVSRDQLLDILKEQSNLQRLTATTRISILKENAVVPATVIDAARKESGKAYQKRWVQAEVNGSLFLSRDAEGHQNICVSGEVQNSDFGFTLLGKDRAFWMLIPTSEEERNKAINQDQAAPRAKVLYGTFDSDALRPKDRYTIRPQDFEDLLLTAEAKRALDGQDICYVEKWQDYYVMNFLRPDWPNHIYSKIWFERQSLTVAIHQLFDSSGELAAEARFQSYGRYPIAQGSKVKIDMPTRVDFLWPRDRVMMKAALVNIKLNGDIPASVFDEKRLESYPTELITAPPAR
jgi:hypothetical protein